MKIARYKKAQKTINFYKHNFDFRDPYQILIDATFCQLALQVNLFPFTFKKISNLTFFFSSTKLIFKNNCQNICNLNVGWSQHNALLWNPKV